MLRYEVWHHDNGDFAQVGIDKESGNIVDVITEDWTYSGQMSYSEGIKWLNGEGFATFGAAFDTWEELDADYYS